MYRGYNGLYTLLILILMQIIVLCSYNSLLNSFTLYSKKNIFFGGGLSEDELLDTPLDVLHNYTDRTLCVGGQSSIHTRCEDMAS